VKCSSLDPALTKSAQSESNLHKIADTLLTSMSRDRQIFKNEFKFKDERNFEPCNGAWF